MTFCPTYKHLFYTNSYEYRLLRGGLEDWFALTRRDQNLRRKPMTVSRDFGIDCLRLKILGCQGKPQRLPEPSALEGDAIDSTLCDGFAL